MIIASVPYFNALPLTHYLPGNIRKICPSKMVQELLKGRIDVALLPVFSIQKHCLHMYPDAGIIACDGTVNSVGFFTRSHITELSQIQSIYFDKESLSSVHLAKIILRKFIQINLDQIETIHHDNKDLADAQVLIGDKALFSELPDYSYWDLGKLWKEFTGTGFVFASWASKRSLNQNEIHELSQAKRLGLYHLDKIISEQDKSKQSILFKYLSENIIFEPTPNIQRGLSLYKHYLEKYGYID